MVMAQQRSGSRALLLAIHAALNFLESPMVLVLGCVHRGVCVIGGQVARAGDLRGIWLNALGRIGKPSHASLHRLKYLRYYGSSHPGTPP
jgi:hypothetical protein